MRDSLGEFCEILTGRRSYVAGLQRIFWEKLVVWYLRHSACREVMCCGISARPWLSQLKWLDARKVFDVLRAALIFSEKRMIE